MRSGGVLSGHLDIRFHRYDSGGVHIPFDNTNSTGNRVSKGSVMFLRSQPAIALYLARVGPVGT